MPKKKSLPGVLCLEGDWDDSDPTSRMTMEPALEVLERMDILTLHHRNVNTLPELWRHLTRWDSSDFNGYRYLYLGFHGKPEVIFVGEEPLGLDTLRENLDGHCDDRIIILASCGALASSDESLKKFCRATGATAVIGYTEVIDFIPSAAFEMILFDYLVYMDGKTPKSIYNAVARDYPDLTQRLGFRVATRTWVSEL